MKKIIIFIIFFCGFVGFSQEVYKVEYTYKDFSQSTKCTLYTNNKDALFKFYDDREMGILDLPDGDVTHVANDELSKFYYTNDKFVFCRHIFSVYEILYFDEYKEKLKWTINIDSKKRIGKYNCTEAKIKLNGRNYTIWFTFDVPVKFGPMKFHSLPGMVVEVAEDTGYFTLTFDKISKTTKPKDFDFYKNYLLVTKKNVYDYITYEKKTVDAVVANKIRLIESIKKSNLEGGNTTVDENLADKNNVDMFVDIPKNLLLELKKYHF